MVPKGEVRDNMANRATALTAIVIVLVGTTGLAGLVTAHDSGHNPPGPVETRSQYELGPIEGPGDPDDEGPIPYTFQAIIFTQCFPTYQVANECIENGGATFQACDSWRHSIAGGRARFDVPCSDAEPYDRLTVDIDAQLQLDRQIPFVITQCGPDDTLCGEGSGGDAANDGDGAFDDNPGPKELETEACSGGHSSGQNIQVPSGDIAPDDENEYPTFGTGDGVVTQAGETYTTHHRGQFATDPDNVESMDNLAGDTQTGMDFSSFTHPGDISDVPHPGIATFAVFIRGAIHGPGNAPCDASRINTLQGDVVAIVS